MLSVITRFLETFAVDGVELCFRDNRYFPPGTGPRAGAPDDRAGVTGARAARPHRSRGSGCCWGAACLPPPTSAT